MAGNDRILLPTLGREFKIGTLYDCRTENIVLPETTFWEEYLLKQNIKTAFKPEQKYEVIPDDSFETKARALNVKESLKVSLLAGSVPFSKSAEYFYDRKASSSQARATLKFSSISRCDYVIVKQLGRGSLKPPDEATHVVISILYGADAFFVFDKQTQNCDEANDAYTKLELSVRNLTKLCERGNNDTAEFDQEFIKDIQCQVYSDTQLVSPPHTLLEMVIACKSLPTYIEPTEIQMIPVKVWLYPLHLLHYPTHKLVKQLEKSTVNSIQEVFESFHQVEVKANDIHRKEVLQCFPGMNQTLTSFVDTVNRYKIEFQKSILRVVPDVRGGTSKQEAIEQLINDHESSIYSWKKLRTWLVARENEVEKISCLIDSFKKCCDMETPKNLKRMRNDLEDEYILCFLIQLDSKNDEFVEKMASFLETKSVIPEAEMCVRSWTQDQDIQNQLMTLADNFWIFAQVNNAEAASKAKFCISSKPFNGRAADIVLFHLGGRKSFIPPAKPSTPLFHSATDTSITVTGITSKLGVKNVKTYEILFKEFINVSENWKKVRIPPNQDDIYCVEGLESETGYIFKVRATCILGYGEESEESEPLKTEKQQETFRLALHMKNFSTIIKPGSPSIFKLPVETIGEDPINSIRFCKIGEQTFPPPPEKIVIMLGETGSGKTTVINGMANYIYDVEWNDDFRFQVITENDEGSGNQACSQTSYITSYTFHQVRDSPLPYTITLIDTPGFNDTSGIQRDEEIVSQIRNLFERRERLSIDHLDAIGFVVKAPDGRLTLTQDYIIHSILSVFGKDVVKNIFLLITFSDGGTPQVLAAAQAAKLPFKDFFKFNNSALFCENQTEKQKNPENFDEMFWKIGIRSCKDFFNALNNVDPRSLQLTREVLQERQLLEETIQGLQIHTQDGIHKLEELNRERTVIKQHKADIKANKNFKYKIRVTKQKKIDLHEEYVTNCLTCNFTCHYPCKIPNDHDKARCAAMRDGSCFVCSQKCPWNVHVNNGYRFELYEDDEYRTSQELKAKFYSATDAKTKVKSMLHNLAADFRKIQVSVYGSIVQAKNSINKLNKIAARSNPLSTADYIELLIKSEKQAAKPGWSKRIDHLLQAKEKAEVLGQVANDPNYDPFKDYLEENADYPGPSGKQETGGKMKKTKKSWLSWS